MGPLFLTGASGFVGRSLLRHLRGAEANVTVLTRSPDALQQAVPRVKEWHYLAGDITRPSDYAKALADAETVIHLAAVTGKAPSTDYVRVIHDGTRRLVGACESSGVSHFILVSTIAAAFPDRRYYPYAEAKARAEEAVRDSDLEWLIVRPTMVFGKGSPVLKGLATLAGAPVGLVPGDGLPMVQPIDRDDLARVLTQFAGEPPGREIIDVGGSDQLSILDLMRRIRTALRGRPGPMVHLPLELMRRVLAGLEPGMLPLLPLTAGQLAPFANDGSARMHRRTEPFHSSLKTVDAMLAHLSP
jgi:NADH dehydrogenase